MPKCSEMLLCTQSVYEKGHNNKQFKILISHIPMGISTSKNWKRPHVIQTLSKDVIHHAPSVVTYHPECIAYVESTPGNAMGHNTGSHWGTEKILFWPETRLFLQTKKFHVTKYDQLTDLNLVL